MVTGDHPITAKAIARSVGIIPGVDILNIDSLPGSDILDSFSSLRDDTDGSGDGLGSDGMVTGDHDDLDTSGPALADGVRDSGSGRVNHGHEADESESLKREVYVLGIEGVSDGVLVSGQHVVTESEDTLAESSELHVGSLESILPLLSHGQLSSVNNDGGAPVNNSLGSSLHHQRVSVVILVLGLVDGHLELVGGVEGDLADLLVLGSIFHDIALGQLGTLENGSLGSVAIDLPLENRNSILTSLELGSVTQSGNPLQSFPAAGLLPGLGPGAGLVLGGVGLNNLVVEPHVGHGHPVLGQGSGLIRADGGGGAQGLHSLQVLHEAVLGGHPLGGEGEADGDGGQQTLGHVGHDDTDQEDDGVQPVVAEDEGDDEESDSEEDSDSGDDVDEVSNLLSNGSLVALQARGQTSNPAHHGVVSNVDHHSGGSSLHGVGGEESQVLGLQRIVVGEFRGPGLGLGLSSQGGVVHLETPGFQYPEIRGNSVSKFDFDNISQSKLGSRNRDFLPVTSDQSVLGHEILERLHDFGGLGFLVVGEDAGDGDDSSEDNSEVEIVIWGLLVGRGLDTVSHETEDGSNPEQTSEPGEQILTEFDPLWGGWRWSQLVEAVLLIAKFCLCAGQTIFDVRRKPFQKLGNFNFVNIKLELFLKILSLLILFS